MHRWRIWALRAAVAASFLAGVGPRAYAQFYDGSNTQYGKNRVQYYGFFWQYYPIEDFHVYHYPNSAPLAGRVVELLPTVRTEIELLFGRKIAGPIDVLVYASLIDFRQSNVGMVATAEGNGNIGGTARLVGNKLFLFGNGTSQQLLADVRSGLTRVLIQQTLQGEGVQDAMRAASAPALPAWFIEGLCSFVGEPWSAEKRMRIVDLVNAGALERIDLLNPELSTLAGHSIWKYISDIYGPATFSNVLNISRMTRSVEGGMVAALGMSMDKVVAEVTAYYEAMRPESVAGVDPGPFRPRRPYSVGPLPQKIRGHVNCIRVSLHPAGNQVAYATDNRGQISIWHYHFETGKTQRIARHGQRLDRIEDGGFPVFAWHPNGNQLLYTTESGGGIALHSVNLTTWSKASRPILNMDRILSLSYSPDGNTLVFSGLRGGRSDLYTMSALGNSHTSLWLDDWDDLSPSFSADGTRIYFSSNRPSTLRGKGAPEFNESSLHDIFSVALNERGKPLTRHTDEAAWDVRNPVATDQDAFLALATQKTGLQELWRGQKDSSIAFIDTIIHYRFGTELSRIATLDQPISSFEFAATADLFASSSYSGSRLFWKKEPWETLGSSPFPSDSPDSSPEWNELGLQWNWIPGPGQVDIRNYTFGPGDPVAKGPEEVQTADNEGTKPRQKELPTQRTYRLNYALESVTSQVANTFGGAFYQPYNGTVQVQPGLGALTSISMADVFEDKRFTAGFRLAGSLENSLFGLAFSDYSRQWDRTLALERQGIQAVSTDGFSLEETHIHTLRYRLTYPFDEVRSLRIEGFSRLDRTTPLATDAWNLAKPNTFAASTGVTLAYVLDTSRDIALNLWEGAKVRTWAEYFIDPSEPKGAGFGTAGIDARWSRRLFSTATCAVRFAADASWGGQRLLHVLGGVDNVLSLTANAGSPIDPGVAYAYQTRFTPMRGFRTNARNGAHAAVVNAEVRIPVLSTWVKRPLTSDFARHLQAVGFFDAGSAWNGLHPYADDNAFNRVTVTRYPITVTIDNNREPILAGTGFGLRSKVLGYWMRADWSWGIDDGRWQDRVFSLSFHLDF